MAATPVLPYADPDSGRFLRIVDGIRRFDPVAAAELYNVFSGGLRTYLRRRLGPEVADEKLHDVLLVVIKAIQQGKLREPDRLRGYVRTVLLRVVADELKYRQRYSSAIETVPDQRIAVPPEHEERLLEREKIDLTEAALSALPPKKREILVRFYVDEQSPRDICEAMNLTYTQFRLLKWRAKAELGRLIRLKRPPGRDLRSRPAPCASYQELPRPVRW